MNKQRKEYLKNLEKYKKEVTLSLRRTQEFLIRVGVHDKTHKLSKNYQ